MSGLTIEQAGAVEANGKGKREEALAGEVSALRKMLERALDSIAGEGNDVLKVGALVARISDSVVRALLAQKRLQTGDNRLQRVQDDIDRVLRELKYEE